jgi:hypothetical protein
MTARNYLNTLTFTLTNPTPTSGEEAQKAKPDYFLVLP